MGKYILKRIGTALLTLLIITFLLFLLVRIMPGNPFPSERMSDDMIANKRAEMGLDDPILVQFANYMRKLLFHGDLATAPPCITAFRSTRCCPPVSPIPSGSAGWRS